MGDGRDTPCSCTKGQEQELVADEPVDIDSPCLDDKLGNVPEISEIEDCDRQRNCRYEIKHKVHRHVNLLP